MGTGTGDLRRRSVSYGRPGKSHCPRTAGKRFRATEDIGLCKTFCSTQRTGIVQAYIRCGNKRLRSVGHLSSRIQSSCHRRQGEFRNGSLQPLQRAALPHPDAPSSAADAVRHTTDLECGAVYSSLPEAVRQGLITEEEIDESLARLLRIRFRLGNFDPEETDDDTERQSAIIRIKGGPVVLAK